VDCLSMVDVAIIGHENDIFETVKLVKPEIIALGYDQIHQEKFISDGCKRINLHTKIVRLQSPVPELSSSDIQKEYGKIDPKFIFVSNNFRYGNKRKGDVKELIAESKKYGFNVIKPEPLRIKKKVVSSTSIRDLLKEGKIKKANKLLSRNWVINGDVQRGRQLGKKLGFPTCNIDINNYISAKPGVYSI